MHDTASPSDLECDVSTLVKTSESFPLHRPLCRQTHGLEYGSDEKTERGKINNPISVSPDNRFESRALTDTETTHDRSSSTRMTRSVQFNPEVNFQSPPGQTNTHSRLPSNPLSSRQSSGLLRYTATPTLLPHLPLWRNPFIWSPEDDRMHRGIADSNPTAYGQADSRTITQQAHALSTIADPNTPDQAVGELSAARIQTR